ncbi:MAG: disulfide bond formation protein DsbD, partial [Alphaproteobacteria bacterium]|nr:disulfide bond formation protein DsbD [Alphaproteobacteria bacterium]
MIGAMVDKALARRLPAGLALALVAMALAVLAVAAPAATTGWQSVEFAQARLIAATTGVGQGSAVDLGLHIRLERGWHTYWRTPGMGGLPPRFDWAGSGNLASVSVGFPAPRRFSAFGAETIGYVDEVVLPIRVRLAVAGAPLDVALALDYAVCAEVCVPVSARFDLRVPAGPAAASPFAALIARYAARVPTPGPLPDLAIAAATLGTGPDGPLLEVAATGAALAA